MTTFLYNDMGFDLEPAGTGWNIVRATANGPAIVGAGLFPGASPSDAKKQAHALVKTIYPVGVKSVGPDVAHPHKIGDLRIVGPNVAHPNFILWDKDSSSFPKHP
ncbi:MAG TPA: hypothetical protein VFW68_11155 [Rhodocyclaceae bacterium]|nr:hypothetical protein [Rhodocyclaceae bacterium]